MTIYPQRSHPYYIVAPPYIRNSAGIKALHLICHHLNLKGFRAYMLIYPFEKPDPAYVNPDLCTPVLSQDVTRHHAKNNLYPIVVVPEMYKGNPLSAPCLVRYCGNFPGLFGGDSKFPDDEYVYSFSKDIATHTSYPDNVLFVPTIDTRVFNTKSQDATPRRGTCFYAGKYQGFHKSKLFPITKGSTEIKRGTDAQSPDEIAHLFRTSELFYAYENTALILEAMLCDCPVVCLPNPHFTEIIGVDEIGTDGYSWGTAPEDIRRATQTVHTFTKRYSATIELFYKQLDGFIENTQNHAKNIYRNLSDVPQTVER